MKKSLAISLALILLLSNAGITMATHFCGGQAVMNKVMLGQGHLNCGMPDMDTDCESESNEGIHYKTNPCCENHYQSLEVEDDYHQSNIVQLNINIDFAIALIHTFLNIELFSEDDKPQYANYSPPLLLRDITVLNQVFII